jgi:hypothetical protein
MPTFTLMTCSFSSSSSHFILLPSAQTAGLGELRRVTAEGIEAQTELLRRSKERFWARLRRLLLERNIDPASSFLATSWPEDESEIGYLVTSDARIFQFEFRKGFLKTRIRGLALASRLKVKSTLRRFLAHLPLTTKELGASWRNGEK